MDKQTVQGSGRKGRKVQAAEPPQVDSEGTEATQAAEDTTPKRSAEEVFLEVSARKAQAEELAKQANDAVDAVNKELTDLANKIHAGGTKLVTFAGVNYKIRRGHNTEDCYFLAEKVREQPVSAEGAKILI